MKPISLVLGGQSGLLGMALAKALNDAGHLVHVTGRPDDKTWDAEAFSKYLNDLSPQFIFNTWAYTQVDKAEDEADEARRINAELPAYLGRICTGRKLTLVHYSTDFVFDGEKGAPYREDDPPTPTSRYGKTKLSGEAELINTALHRLIIIRTAWLFGPGKKNFVRTILNLAESKDELRVIDDQIGSPTYTPDLAEYSIRLIQSDAEGIFHVVNGEPASWHELALSAVTTMGLSCKVVPIPSAEYPQKALRPAYSVLDTGKFTSKTGISPRPWKEALGEYLHESA
jgi:dTDP-4-dehydrorhamnose reductase